MAVLSSAEESVVDSSDSRLGSACGPGVDSSIRFSSIRLGSVSGVPSSDEGGGLASSVGVPVGVGEGLGVGDGVGVVEGLGRGLGVVDGGGGGRISDT